jgi:hypothetical protein
MSSARLANCAGGMSGHNRRRPKQGRRRRCANFPAISLLRRCRKEDERMGKCLMEMSFLAPSRTRSQPGFDFFPARRELAGNSRRLGSRFAKSAATPPAARPAAPKNRRRDNRRTMFIAFSPRCGYEIATPLAGSVPSLSRRMSWRSDPSPAGPTLTGGSAAAKLRSSPSRGGCGARCSRGNTRQAWITPSTRQSSPARG